MACASLACVVDRASAQLRRQTGVIRRRHMALIAREPQRYASSISEPSHDLRERWTGIRNVNT